MDLLVKRLEDDFWSRPRLKNIDNGRIYADVSCGDERYQPRKYNISGDWHSTSKDGEPDCPLREDITFYLQK